MAAQPEPFLSPEEYLERERLAETKSEYMGGEVIAMAGVSFAHATIVNNLVEGIGPSVRKKGCRTVSSDLRVQVERTGAYVYPDMVVYCGEPRFADSHLDTLLNPTVIIEVLSPSTEAYDRGVKWAHYRRLPGLQHYVLVAQDRPLVEVYTRHADVWVFAEYAGLDAVLELPEAGARIPLSEVFDGVTFPAEAGG